MTFRFFVFIVPASMKVKKLYSFADGKWYRFLTGRRCLLLFEHAHGCRVSDSRNREPVYIRPAMTGRKLIFLVLSPVLFSILSFFSLFNMLINIYLLVFGHTYGFYELFVTCPVLYVLSPSPLSYLKKKKRDFCCISVILPLLRFF